MVAARLTSITCVPIAGLSPAVIAVKIAPGTTTAEPIAKAYCATRPGSRPNTRTRSGFSESARIAIPTCVRPRKYDSAVNTRIATPIEIAEIGATNSPSMISTLRLSGVVTVSMPRPATEPIRFWTMIWTPKAAMKTVKNEASWRWIGR